jgi:hypothetical protein
MSILYGVKAAIKRVKIFPDREKKSVGNYLMRLNGRDTH